MTPHPLAPVPSAPKDDSRAAVYANLPIHKSIQVPDLW